MKQKCDVLIIGAGILGCLTARELMRYKLDVLVLERASDLGEGATKANTGVLYAGFHARGGSLKGVACAKGNRMHEGLSKELDVAVRYPGSLFVAFHDEGVNDIEKKIKNGKMNGVTEMKMISGDEARLTEPMLSERVIAAMYSPNTGIISPFHLVLNSALNAVLNGAFFQFDSRVVNIKKGGGGYTVYAQKSAGGSAGDAGNDEIQCRYIVNTAGDEASDMEGFVKNRDLVIRPKRGEYLVFDEPSPINHVIYQAQEDGEKGTLLAPTVDGNMVIGPTSEKVRSYKNTETSVYGREHITKVAKKVLPSLDMSRVIAAYAGVRANIENLPKEEKDFVIRVSSDRFISALGIKNPGLTASPYLVNMIIDGLKEQGLKTEINAAFNPIYKAKPLFLKSDAKTQRELLKKDPSYGNVVCRCEKITEGDILNSLDSPLPPHNLNGLKKRLRTGMGRCQGGFCTPQIIDILSREWKVTPEKIFKAERGSMIVKGYLR